MPNTIEPIPNVENPIIGTIATTDIGQTQVEVTGIWRYNGNGRFTCSVTDNATFHGTMDVYYDTVNLVWKAKEYVPERYRDEEGVQKNM